jgi:hypothetical protein
LRKPIELPPQVAKAYVRDMKAFFRAKDQLKQDEIAALACWELKQHLPRDAKLRITDVAALSGTQGSRMTVWMYVDTRKDVGDKDQFKVFANADAAEAWFARMIPRAWR